MVIINLEDSLTKNCMQCGWSAPHYFPCSPQEIKNIPLDDYYRNLKIGAIFAYHDDAPKLIVNEFVKARGSSPIFIICERDDYWCERAGFFPWLVCEITFEDEFFIHYKLEEFFEKDEAYQAFNTKRGEKS